MSSNVSRRTRLPLCLKCAGPLLTSAPLLLFLVFPHLTGQATALSRSAPHSPCAHVQPRPLSALTRLHRSPAVHRTHPPLLLRLSPSLFHASRYDSSLGSGHILSRPLSPLSTTSGASPSTAASAVALARRCVRRPPRALRLFEWPALAAVGSRLGRLSAGQERRRNDGQRSRPRPPLPSPSSSGRPRRREDHGRRRRLQVRRGPSDPLHAQHLQSARSHHGDAQPLHPASSSPPPAVLPRCGCQCWPGSSWVCWCWTGGTRRWPPAAPS